MSATVWIAETTGYPEETEFFGAWSSPEAAYEGIRAYYVGVGYTGKWSGLHRNGDDYGFHFIHAGYKEEWRIQAVEIDKFPYD